MSPEVSIIIVSYNGRKLIHQCIQSVIANTKNVDYEIIIVDNASSDDSKKYVTLNFPEVRWIQSPQNLGFGKANNLGVKHAIGKYIFFLNPDTIIKNNAIAFFIDFLSRQNDEKIGIIGGYLLDNDNKLNSYAGDIITCIDPIKDLFKGIFKNIFSKTTNPNIIESVGYVCGADLFMTKSLFNEIGGFDENFFMYCEEVDLQKRILETGRKNLIIPGPQIIHLEGGGKYKVQGISTRRFCMWMDSKRYYTRKHFSNIQLTIWKILNPIQLIPLIIKQNWSFKEKFRAFLLALKS